MRKRLKGFTLIEIMIAILIMSMVLYVVHTTFISGTKAYRKEVDALTIIGSARYSIVRMREDIRNANFIKLPSADGKEYDELVLIKHLIDFSKNPENTPGKDTSQVYFINQKITYFLKDPTFGADTAKKQKYKDLKLLVRKVEWKDSSGSHEEETVLNENMKKLVFRRNKMAFTNISDAVEPMDAGISSNNIEMRLTLKSYREEDAKIMNITDFDSLSGFEVEFPTFVNSRGAFLGGNIDDF